MNADPKILQGKKLQELRKKHKMTQEQVAAYLSTSRQNYSHYETGRNQPPLDTLMALSKLWKINITDLVIDYDTPSIFRESNPYHATVSEDKLSASSILYDSNTFAEENELIQTFRCVNEEQKRQILQFAKFISEYKP